MCGNTIWNDMSLRLVEGFKFYTMDVVLNLDDIYWTYWYIWNDQSKDGNWILKIEHQQVILLVDVQLFYGFRMIIPTADSWFFEIRESGVKFETFIIEISHWSCWGIFNARKFQNFQNTNTKTHNIYRCKFILGWLKLLQSTIAETCTVSFKLDLWEREQVYY